MTLLNTWRHSRQRRTDGGERSRQCPDQVYSPAVLWVGLALHISRFWLHALQKAKRVERANGDQFEAHHMCFTQRQLFEHFVSDGRIGDVDDERHARLSL